MENNGLATKIDRPYHLATYLYFAENSVEILTDSPFSNIRTSVLQWYDTPAHHVARRGFVEAELQASSKRILQKATDRQTYIHRVPLGEKTHEMDRRVRTGRVDVSSSPDPAQDRTIFPEDTLITFRNTIQALSRREAGEDGARTGKNGKDLRTSVTIRLIKKDVNADAVDWNKVERLRKWTLC
jgi:hypothetical protein